MNASTNGARWTAVATAALLFVTGSVMGVVVDRLWLSPPEIHATPLTAGSLAEHLDLSSAEEVRLRALLDSLHSEILRHGPDSLGAAVRDAQLRIEAALPLGARTEFRAWVQEHHRQLMNRLPRGH